MLKSKPIMNNFTKENNDLNVDIKKLFLIFLQRKFFIFLFAICSFIFSFIYAQYLPNMYTSESILAPTKVEDSLTNQIQNYSSLASFAGIKIPNEGASKSMEAIERIYSYQFFISYFLPNISLENLMAQAEWDSEKKLLTHNNDLFDDTLNQWVEGKKPSAQDAYRIYKDLIKISVDNDTLFITLSIDHISPFVAKKWVEIIIFNINESMRKEERVNAEHSIEFLNESFKNTNIQSIRDAISSLLEVQLQTLMLISANQDYVFKMLDIPLVQERKSGPNRFLISFLGILLGTIVSLLIIILQSYSKLFKS